MASAETRKDVVMTEKCKMANVRREIGELFVKYEGYLKESIGKLTRDAHDALEGLETAQEANDNAEASEHSQAKIFDSKIQELDKIKEEVEQCLEPLQKFSSGEKLSKSEGKGKGKAAAAGGELNKDVQAMDVKLEKILEDATVINKGKEFDDLTDQVKMCLMCFSIFPIDAVVEKRVLIYWWIGEHFVTAKENKTAVEDGEDVFKKLVERDFICPVYNKRRGDIVRCQLHPWIRWMIISKSRKANFFNLDETGKPSLTPSKSRHACLISENPNKKETPYSPHANEPSLRTLFNVNVKYLSFSSDSFSKMKTLVVLHLGSWKRTPPFPLKGDKNDSAINHHIEIEGPENLASLGLLEQLRYLSLRGISMVSRLPNSIRALRNLKILDLRGCQNLEQLPDTIKWLKQLTHLDVSECYMLEDVPKALSSLTKLQVLKGFVFGSFRSKNPCKLAELAKLENLRKLSITIGSQVNPENVDLHEMTKLKRLKSLTITWGQSLKIRDLEFPYELWKLDLRCFPEEDMPKWLDPKKLPFLKRLYIRGGKLKRLRLEGWKIEMLRLKFLKELDLSQTEIGLLHPNLVHLEIHDCNQDIPQLDRDSVWVRKTNDDAPFSTKKHDPPTTTTASTSAGISASTTEPDNEAMSSDAIPDQEPSSASPATAVSMPSSTTPSVEPVPPQEPSTTPADTPSPPSTAGTAAMHVPPPSDSLSTLDASPSSYTSVPPAPVSLPDAFVAAASAARDTSLTDHVATQEPSPTSISTSVVSPTPISGALILAESASVSPASAITSPSASDSIPPPAAIAT